MKYRDPETGEFKELYTKAADTLPVGTVVDFDGDEVPAGWEAAGSDDYSTEETFTGKYWIDGKKIYRKVINTGELPNANGKTINHNISNIDNILNINGWTYRNTDNVFLPLPNAASDNTSITCYSNKTNIAIVTYSDRSSFTISYVIIEYTKTTD